MLQANVPLRQMKALPLQQGVMHSQHGQPVQSIAYKRAPFEVRTCDTGRGGCCSKGTMPSVAQREQTWSKLRGAICFGQYSWLGPIGLHRKDHAPPAAAALQIAETTVDAQTAVAGGTYMHLAWCAAHASFK